MLEVARESLGPAAELALLALPDDPLPAADAVVSVGHPLSDLASAAEVGRALTAMAAALRPGGQSQFARDCAVKGSVALPMVTMRSVSRGVSGDAAM